MKIIKDTNGREYCLSLTISTIGRIKDTLGVDLLDLTKFFELGQLELINVFVESCRESWEGAKLNSQQFIDRFEDGDSLDAALNALVEELLRFFPKRRREVIAKAFAAVKELETRQTQILETKLETGEFAKELGTTLGESSGNSPESSASTPAPSPSDSSH